ncbi:hypothetical protein JL721_3624 [Aureococcus anophagefferens]|nr:hypothetical protein JL721_3624 [Aureococcus anophagefferens]
MVRTCYECGWKSDDITYHVMNSVQVACCTQCATPIPLSAHVKPETGAINVSAAPGKPVVIDLADSDDDEKPAKARRVAEVIDLESDDEAPPAPAAPRPAPARKKGPPVPPLKGVKPEKRPVKPEAVKPEKKRPADDDGDVPLFSLKKKVSAPPPKKARLSEAGSSDDDGEPPPPPLQRADFAAWLAEREKSGVPALDADQRRACDAVVRDGKNVFVTGSGGNGKSHVTRTILDFFGEHYGDMYGQRVAVCAPTGIAATHVNGTTIHSATGIGVPKCNEDFRRMHQGFRKELWTKLVEVLVIDEISMLSGEWFDNLDRTLRELAHCHTKKIYFTNRGYAFQSKAWFNADMVYVHLRTCHRVGAHEQKFVDVLNRLRAGTHAPRDVDALNAVAVPAPGHPDDVDPTEIWPTNAKDEIRHALETCDFIKYNKLIEPMVDLKPGCRVLLLKNIDTRNEAKKEQPLVNGTTGRVLRWATAAEAETALAAREQALEDKLEAAKEQRERKGKRSYETSLERKLYEELQKLRSHCASYCGHDVDANGNAAPNGETLFPYVRFSKGREEVVLPALFDEELVGQGVAYVMQMPLKLGYAVTIHKSQGMSLDHATISTSGCFAEGQAYVALSRVTGAKALALARPLKGVDVKTPKLSKTFYDLCDALAKEAEDLGGADALGMGPVALRGVLEGMPPSAARDRALEIVANLDPSLDQDAPGVLHWQTKKPSVAREEYGGSGVGSTSKGKAGRCYKCQQLGHWASDCPN